MVNLIKLFDDNDFYKRLSNVVLKMKEPLNLQHVNQVLFFERENINTRNTIILFDEYLVERYQRQLMQLSVTNYMVFVYQNNADLANSVALEIADNFLKNEFDAKQCSALLHVGYRTVMTDEEQDENQILLSGKIAGYTNKTLEILLNNLNEGVFWKDAQSIYFGCNQQFCDDFGIGNPQEIIGKTDRDFLNDRDYKEFIAYDQQVIEQGRNYPNIEKEITLQVGKKWLQIQKFPIKDRSGNTYGILGLYHKREEEKSNIANLPFDPIFIDKLLEVTSDSIYFKDAESSFISANKTHLQYLNALDHQEIVGKTDFDYLDAEIARKAFADEQQIIFENSSIENKIEHQQLLNKSNWLKSSKFPVTDEKGLVKGIIGIAKDITKEVLLKTKLDQSVRIIEELVNTSDSAVLIKDKQLNIVDANKAAVALFGVQSVNELIGKKEIHFVDDLLVSKIVEEDLEVINSGVALLDKLSDFKSGTAENQLKVSRIPVRDENAEVFALIVKIRF